jgi:replicative superfamily II helicase
VEAALAARLEFTALIREAIPPRFNSPNTRSAKIAEEWLGTDHPVALALRAGIALHHGGLPDTLRKAVEADFREGNYRVIVATNTLAQGVNLPIRTVVVHSCWRSDGENRSRIAARDYWNIAGRAGRAGHETEGTIIHIVLNDSDVNDVSLMLKERISLDPVSSALFQLLQDLVTQRIYEQAASEILDPEILAMLVEESVTNDPTSSLDSVLNKSLAARQAAGRHYDLLNLA